MLVKGYNYLHLKMFITQPILIKIMPLYIFLLIKKYPIFELKYNKAGF